MAAEPSTTTAVGSLLNGTYRLERAIAEGGMGVVYEASHVRLPRRFAVKVLGKPKQTAGEAQLALARFQREAEIASTLAHPHIVEVFDYQVSEGGSPYLVMELLEGEDLSDRLKRHGRLPVVAALRIIDEMAQALDCAHERGVVHRDLKPANVFLSRTAGRDDWVKVLDFGVSKFLDAATLTQEKAMVGTPLYMSPEQAVGTQELSPESDVFSLGAIAYEMLSGRRAFAASSIPSILFQIVHGPTPTLSGKGAGFSTALDEVFAKVLAKKRVDRFARASHFAQELAKALTRPGDGPVWAPESGPLQLPRPPTGVGAGGAETEVDPSTRAHAAMPDPVRADGLPALAFSTRSLVAELPRARAGGWWLLAAALTAAAIGVFVYSRSRTAATPIVVATNSQPQSQPQPQPQPQPTPVVTQLPLPSPSHPDVQFVFHVVPRSAQITVDDRRVGSQLTLPWQARSHLVRVTAPGYRPLTITALSTATRTFELRMERLLAPARPAKPARPRHDAAPVQDL